jgi:hypothetical protein
MKKEILFNPVFETKINKAVFINQDIIVYPSSTSMPEKIINVIKFLFGEGVELKQDTVNGRGCLIIKGATYILSGVKTLNADWTFKEVKQEGGEW